MAVVVAWMDRANCLGTDPEAFFPEAGALQQPGAAPATRVCARCEVQAECLRYAIENDLDHGIFGGLLPSERRRVTLAVVA